MSIIDIVTLLQKSKISASEASMRAMPCMHDVDIERIFLRVGLIVILTNHSDIGRIIYLPLVGVLGLWGMIWRIARVSIDVDSFEESIAKRLKIDVIKHQYPFLWVLMTTSIQGTHMHF